MVLLTMSLLAVAASYALLAHFQRTFRNAPPWGIIFRTAIWVMSLRLTALGLGTYCVKSSGPAQVLGYLLVNAGLPEMAHAGRERPGAGGRWLITALVGVALGSLLWVTTVGIIALKLRSRGPAGS